jgi:hypothetical protein
VRGEDTTAFLQKQTADLSYRTIGPMQCPEMPGHSSAELTEIFNRLQPDQMHETVNRI